MFLLLAESSAKCRKERPKKQKKLKRRMSDVGKSNENSGSAKNTSKLR